MAYQSNLLNGENTNLSYKDTTLPNDDNEEIIVIDSGLRHIKLPESLKTIGVTGDQNCETVFFQIPRYFDGIDLSNHKCLIRYINAGKEYGEYYVEDLAIDDNFIVFGWQVSNYVTRYHGTVNFTVQFETVDINGVSYQWQTVPNQLTVLSALNIESTITDKDETLFRKLSNQVEYLQDKCTQLETQIDKINNKIKDYDELNKRVEYLENNVVYTLSEI